MHIKTDTSKCPLCGEANQCGAHKEGPCWCTTVKIPEALIRLVPEAHGHKACICRKCIDRFNSAPDTFADELAGRKPTAEK